MRTEDLTLSTHFRGGIVFGNLPANSGLIQQYQDELDRHAIPVRVVEDEDDVVLSYRITIAEAFAIGYNRYAPDELKFALLDTYPELRAHETSLERRIRELERLYWIQRASSRDVSRSTGVANLWRGDSDTVREGRSHVAI